VVVPPLRLPAATATTLAPSLHCCDIRARARARRARRRRGIHRVRRAREAGEHACMLRQRITPSPNRISRRRLLFSFFSVVVLLRVVPEKSPSSSLPRNSWVETEDTRNATVRADAGKAGKIDRRWCRGSNGGFEGGEEAGVVAGGCSGKRFGEGTPAGAKGVGRRGLRVIPHGVCGLLAIRPWWKWCSDVAGWTGWTGWTAMSDHKGKRQPLE